jgi:hypothetical protein
MARQEVPPQPVDAGGMRMMNNALWIPKCAVELQLAFVRGGTLPLCRAHRAYEAKLGAIKEYVAQTTMATDVKVFVQNCLHCVATVPGNRRATPAGYAATCDQAQRDPALRLPVNRVVKRREVSVLATSQG